MLHSVVSVCTSVANIAVPVGYDPESPQSQRDLITLHGDGPVELKLRFCLNLQNW